MLADQFCKDFYFTNLVVCAKHSQVLQSNLQLNIDKTPIECYNIEKDLESPNDLEELRNLAIKETKGNREIQNIIPSRTDSSYNHPLKLCKVNIRTIEKPKIAMVGYYWDEKTSQ